MKLSVLLPVYNEAATISSVLERVSRGPLPEGMDKEIVVVDDGSTDGGPDLVARQFPSVRLERHPRNRGKGAAIAAAVRAATGDILLIQDADLEYDPAEYPKLVRPILEDKADVVYGSRFLTSDYHRVLLFKHFLGNKFITFMSDLFSNYNLTDIETGYKVFRADLIKSINLRENRFGFEVEITHKIARRKARVYEVGISYSGRDFHEGKKIKPIRDGLWALLCILKYGALGLD